MTQEQSWGPRFDHELSMALAARKRGNEGRARVCARRAAGVVLEEYFHRLDLPLNTASAIERLRAFTGLPGVPPEALELAQHFLLHVDVDHSLPEEIDLIAEAQRLRAILLG